MAQGIEKVILELAKETGWGYYRILRELKNFGIESVTRNTVKNILKRTDLTLAQNAVLLLGMSSSNVTHPPCGSVTSDSSRRRSYPTGLRDIFVLVFLHVKSRQFISRLPPLSSMNHG